MEAAIKVLHNRIFEINLKIIIFEEHGWNTLLLTNEVTEIQYAIRVLKEIQSLKLHHAL